MKKQYGILMSRQNVTSEMFLFNPKCLVVGCLVDEEESFFEDERGITYPLSTDVETVTSNLDTSVAYVCDEEELLEKYHTNSISQAMESFYSDILDSIHIGFYVLLEDKIILRSYNLSDEMAKVQLGEEFESVKTLEHHDDENRNSVSRCDKDTLSELLETCNGDEVIPFTVEEFKKILQLDSYEAIKGRLEEIYTEFQDMNLHFLNAEKKEQEACHDILERNISYRGEDLISYFDNICMVISKTYSLSSMVNLIGVFETSLRNISEHLNDLDAHDPDIPMAISYIHQLLDELELILSASDVALIKSDFESVHKKERINIKQIASLYDKYGSLEKLESTTRRQTERNGAEGIPVKEMKKFFDERIIGQENAKRAVISVLKMNSLCEHSWDRIGCLLVGPTGSGKTLIAKTTAEFLDKPMEIFDTTQLTVPGYVGANIEDFLARLLTKAGGDLQKAQHGIVFFDEIDKKGSEKNDDVSGRGVLNTLLSFFSGTTYNIKYKNTTVYFDTSHLTIMAGGAFTDVAKGKIKNSKVEGYKSTKIGFGTSLEDTTKNEEDIVYPTLEHKDFVKYGNMTDEIMSRLPVIAQLSGQTRESLKKILTDSQISPLRSCKKILGKLGVDLSWTEGYLDAVANRSLKQGTGARALQSTVENSISLARWEAFENPDEYCGILLTEKSVEDPEESVLVNFFGETQTVKELITSKNKMKNANKVKKIGGFTENTCKFS